MGRSKKKRKKSEKKKQEPKTLYEWWNVHWYKVIIAVFVVMFSLLILGSWISHYNHSLELSTLSADERIQLLEYDAEQLAIRQAEMEELRLQQHKGEEQTLLGIHDTFGFLGMLLISFIPGVLLMKVRFFNNVLR